MCHASREEYDRVGRALASLLARLRGLVERASRIRPEQLPPAERYRVEMVQAEAERLLSEVERLEEDLAAWSPHERVCYGEFWSRIHALERRLPGLEERLANLEAASKNYRILNHNIYRPTKYVIEVEKDGRREVIVTPRTKDPWEYALRWTSAWGGRVTAIYPLREKLGVRAV